ncbi:hypothetical protein [Paraburkholderia sp. JHI2823]|uniref:hypothetical protein n=1 Tax=Paraburkholderia sp. JHI2823 TaxID=3112960 RepID=UPI00319DA2CC
MDEVKVGNLLPEARTLKRRPSSGCLSQRISWRSADARAADGRHAKFVETATFLRWPEGTKSAEPACHKMPDDIKQMRFARWANQMAEIDRLAALTLAQI